MRRSISLVLLIAVLFFGILTLWIPASWALSVFQVGLIALAVLRLLTRLRQGRGIGKHLIGFLLTAAAFWGLVQVAAGSTVDSLKTQQAVLDWVVNLTAYSLACEPISGEQQYRFWHAVAMFAGILALLSLFTLLTSPRGTVLWWFHVDSDVPVPGPFLYRNQYASFVEAILPFCWLEAIRDHRRRVLYTLITAVLFASVVAGGSRAGTALCLAEVVAVPLIAFAQGRISRQLRLPVMVASLGLIAVSTAVVGSGVIERRFREPRPFTVRGALVRSTLAMIHDRPWAGFGLGTWSAAYPAYASYDDGTFVNQAHNDWLQWGAEGGLPFLALLLLVAARTFRPAIRSIWGIGLLAVFFHGLLDYPMQQRPALAAFFFALLGTLAAFESSRKPAGR